MWQPKWPVHGQGVAMQGQGHLGSHNYGKPNCIVSQYKECNVTHLHMSHCVTTCWHGNGPLILVHHEHSRQIPDVFHHFAADACLDLQPTRLALFTP